MQADKEEVADLFARDTNNTAKKASFLPQLAASCIVYLLVIQAGINMSFASVLIAQLSDAEEIAVDTKTASIIGSIWSISLPIGALASGALMDRLGRRRLALLVCLPFCGAWLLVAFARDVATIYAARIVAGICCGLTTVSVVYTAEISHRRFRSALLCMNSVWVSFGIFLTFLLNFLQLGWRLIGGVFALVSLLSMALLLLVPESPHWLLASGRSEEELRRCIAWFYRCPATADKQYEELLAGRGVEGREGEGESRKEGGREWLAAIKLPQVHRPLLVLIILFLLQQLSGGYVLIFYTINIFRNLGADFAASVDEKLASLLLGTIRLVMAVVAAALSQRCNRKTLLYVSTLGMATFAFLAAVQVAPHSGHALFLRSGGKAAASNFLVLACILAYILFASLGLLIVPWTCIAELFPPRFKASFGGLTVAIAYVLMSAVLKAFPFVLESVSIGAVFAFFGTASLACCAFVRLFLPETHRKTFAEIEAHFLEGR